MCPSHWAFLAAAVTFAQEKISSNTTDIAGNLTSLEVGVDYTGKPEQFDVMARLVRANALLPFVFFLLLTVSLFLAKFLTTFFNVCASMCCQVEEKVDDVASFSTLALPGDERYDDPSTNPNIKLSGLRSYRIEDNPEYMALFPEVLDIGAERN